MTRGAGAARQRQLDRSAPRRRAASRRTPPGPLARAEHWSHLAADGALHCTLWAAEWPRIDVRALFLQPLLMDSRTTRTIAMCMELVGPCKAIRQAERAATETATEQSLRARVGQRTSQRQSQRDHAADQRERELAEGHAAVRYAAYVTVSVPWRGPTRSRELESRRLARRARGQARPAAPGADVGPAGRGVHLRPAALPGAAMSDRSRAPRAAP